VSENTPYPFVVAWCRMMGSFSYYVRDQVELAQRTKAPKDATYQRGDGSWCTYDELPERTKVQVQQAAENVGLKLPGVPR
jgi:hypothetical protein